MSEKIGERTAYVPIHLDVKRKIHFDLNAMATIEEVFQKPLAQILNMNMGLREFRALLWAGLLHEAPMLTQEQVGKMIDRSPEAETLGEKLAYVSEKVLLALTAFMGTTPEEAQEGEPEKNSEFPAPQPEPEDPDEAPHGTGNEQSKSLTESST
jgi:hypothetical protein